MSKLTIPFERCWLVRSLSSSPPRQTRPLFWVAGNEWNGSPMHATIFQSEASAQRQIDDARHYGRAGFGRNAVVEAVPLEGAAKTLGIEVQL